MLLLGLEVDVGFEVVCVSVGVRSLVEVALGAVSALRTNRLSRAGQARQPRSKSRTHG
ncbi:MAG: hypothetical protein V9G19_13995 [Tetrasphaera sp.]